MPKFEDIYRQTVEYREQQNALDAQLQGAPLEAATRVEQVTPNSSSSMQVDSPQSEPKRLKISFGKKVVQESAIEKPATPSVVVPQPMRTRIIVSKPVVMKVPTVVQDSSEDEDEDDGFADVDLRGTGTSFDEKNVE